MKMLPNKQLLDFYSPFSINPLTISSYFLILKSVYAEIFLQISNLSTAKEINMLNQKNPCSSNKKL